MRACGLNGIQITKNHLLCGKSSDSKSNMYTVDLLWSIKEHFNNQISAFDMIEENKQTPMYEPGALL